MMIIIKSFSSINKERIITFENANIYSIEFYFEKKKHLSFGFFLFHLHLSGFTLFPFYINIYLIFLKIEILMKKTKSKKNGKSNKAINIRIEYNNLFDK